jgi:predicted transcriptional regulator of viral defense system
MPTPAPQGTRLLRELFLRGKRIFNMREIYAAAAVQKIPPKQLRKILSHLSQRGWLFRVKRGLYIAVGFEPNLANLHPFIIATHLIQPSAISHWSALQHHGFIDETPPLITASTPKKVVTPSMRVKTLTPPDKHRWELGGIQYEFITVKKQHFFGIEKIWLGESEGDFQVVPMTDKERTLLDLFVSPIRFGGMDHCVAILKAALPQIDVAKLKAYAERYGKDVVIKRVKAAS